MKSIYSNPYKPTIPEPCHEDWNTMTPQDKGRHCQVCDKVVVDFSNHSEEEIQQEITELQNKGNRVCGHFNLNQLNQPITVVLHRPSHQWRKKWMAFWSFIGFSAISTTGCAQSNTEKHQMQGKVIATQNQNDTTTVLQNTRGTVVAPDTSKTCNPNDDIMIDGAVAPVELKGDIAAPTDNLHAPADEEANFPGGKTAIARYISDHMKLQKSDYQYIPKDTIQVKLIISKEGHVKHVEIPETVNPNIKNKLQEVLYAMPTWSPAVKNGKKVSSYTTLPLKLKTQ